MSRSSLCMRELRTRELHQRELTLERRRRGFHLITDEIAAAMPELASVRTGLLHVFIMHTSASLTINENADADVLRDMEASLNELAPEISHTVTPSRPDDMRPTSRRRSWIVGHGSRSRRPLVLGTCRDLPLRTPRQRGRRRLTLTLQGKPAPKNSRTGSDIDHAHCSGLRQNRSRSRHPDANLVGPLGLRPVEPLPEPERVLAAALANPIGTPPWRVGPWKEIRLHPHLRHHAAGANELLLRQILPALEQAGIPRDKILVLIGRVCTVRIWATNWSSSWDPRSRRYRVENHDGRNLAEHTFLGASPRGVPAWIDTRYVSADLKIATGLIEPHLMAGYSGAAS